MRFIIILITIIALTPLGYSATIYVPDDYTTIQEAIDAAQGGDTVIVRPGTYYESIDFLGKAITVMSEQGADITTIDGGNIPDLCLVWFKNGEGPGSVLEGFTLTNNPSGGGIWCSSSSPTIIHNIITGNSKAWGGGGIYCYNSSSPIVTNNDITGNWAYFGGGIYCDGGSPIITNNTITGNSVPHDGGGIYCEYSFPTITNNIITGNSVTGPGGGGGIYCESSSPIITSNTITGNESYYTLPPGHSYGGGICCTDFSSLTITNNLISGNSACGLGDDGCGGGIYFNGFSLTITNNTIFGNIAGMGGGGICGECSSLNIVNTILWGNSAPIGPEVSIGGSSILTFSYSNVKGGQSSVCVDPGSIINWGPGMIDANPLFLDPLNDDYHLTYASPCIDAGDNSATSLPAKDFEGDPRIYQGTVDMGADEFYTHLYVTGDKTPGGAIQGKFVGLPGTTPVGLFIGSGILPSPMPTMWGEYHLQAPWFLFTLIPIPSNGILELPTTLPGSIPAPYDVPMQALIGLNADSLTNLEVLEVR